MKYLVLILVLIFSSWVYADPAGVRECKALNDWLNETNRAIIDLSGICDIDTHTAEQWRCVRRKMEVQQYSYFRATEECFAGKGQR